MLLSYLPQPKTQKSKWRHILSFAAGAFANLLILGPTAPTEPPFLNFGTGSYALCCGQAVDLLLLTIPILKWCFQLSVFLKRLILIFCCYL